MLVKANVPGPNNSQKKEGEQNKLWILIIKLDASGKKREERDVFMFIYGAL